MIICLLFYLPYRGNKYRGQVTKNLASDLNFPRPNFSPISFYSLQYIGKKQQLLIGKKDQFLWSLFLPLSAL